MGILAITRVILIAEKIVLAMRNVYLAIKIVMNNYQNGHIGHFKGISGHFWAGYGHSGGEGYLGELGH